MAVQRTYIFLTRRITEVGGAEQYIANKAGFLKESGWRVFVFSGRPGTIRIDEFREYAPFILPELAYSPDFYPRRRVEAILEKILAAVGDCGDGCIIQSDAGIRAIWGELLAPRLGARHLAFLLQEEHRYSDALRRFLRFKYERHELAGIVKNAVAKMLDDDSIEPRTDTAISTFCNNVVEDVPEAFTAQLDSSATRTIGSIGRLEKPCVRPILDGILRYSDRHPAETLNLVLVGGAPTPARESGIKALFSGHPRIRLLVTGNLHPIPKRLLDRIDAFVSTAGSARVSFRAGRPTVLVHPVSGVPAGIPGLDFDYARNTMYDARPELSVEGCLERIFAGRDEIHFPPPPVAYRKFMHAEFERQLAFGVPGLAWYDRAKLLRMPLRPGGALHRLAMRILLGLGGSAWVQRAGRRLRKRGPQG
jgi:hypothetical protein